MTKILIASLACIATSIIGTPVPSSVARDSGFPKATGRVTGTVFDSLTMHPLASASVWIAGTSHATSSDAAGRFTLDSVPEGRQVLSFSAPQLDSAGLSALGAVVEIKSGTDATVQLTSPSLRTLWKIMCARVNGPVTDSGIVYGIVRDGDTRARLVKAPTSFSWLNMNVTGTKLDYIPTTQTATSDSTGAYYACGLPTGLALSIRALGNKAASGEIGRVLGQIRVARIDFTVTKDLASIDSTHGRGIVRGYVRNDSNQPVADAVVSIASSDTAVRTNSEGLFVLQHVPAGTQSLQVRKVGLTSVQQTLDLIPDQAAETSVRMSSSTKLETVNVRAKANVTVYQQEYLDRRQLGLGKAIEFDKHNYPDLISPLRAEGRVTLKTGTNSQDVKIMMKMGQTDCFPRLYLDGGLVSEEIIATIPSEAIRAVEIFASFANLPARFMGPALGGVMSGGAKPATSRSASIGQAPGAIIQRPPTSTCGAIAWWTKTALPETPPV